MSDKTKSRPAGGTARAGRGENAACGRAAFSTPYCIMDSTGTQSIFDLLPQGEGNAISSKALAELVGASSVRDLQNRVAAEREQGALILSTCRNGGGYFRPSDGPEGQAEIDRFIATLRARAINTLRAIRAVKLAQGAKSGEVDGQIGFDDLQAAFDILETK